jgi:class 3 adenylate cyclase
MFTDLVGSTDLASTLDPEDSYEVLNAYQHRVAAIVTSQGGVIAQFQGDGAVAYFGYPEAQESASRDALVAGWIRTISSGWGTSSRRDPSLRRPHDSIERVKHQARRWATVPV